MEETRDARTSLRDRDAELKHHRSQASALTRAAERAVSAARATGQNGGSCNDGITDLKKLLDMRRRLMCVRTDMENLKTYVTSIQPTQSLHNRANEVAAARPGAKDASLLGQPVRHDRGLLEQEISEACDELRSTGRCAATELRTHIAGL